MRAGNLDREISIERKESTLDPVYGTELVSWVPLIPIGSPPVAGRLWAQIQDVLPSRSEVVQQGLTIARNQSRVRIRFRADIDPSMRVTVHGDGGDVVMQIVGGPAEIGRREWTEFILEKYSS